MGNDPPDDSVCTPARLCVCPAREYGVYIGPRTPVRGSWEWTETWRDEALVYGEVALPFIATQRRGASVDDVSVAEKEGGHIVQIDRHHAHLRSHTCVRNQEVG